VQTEDFRADLFQSRFLALDPILAGIELAAAGVGFGFKGQPLLFDR
jgi:hypothetical protein